MRHGCFSHGHSDTADLTTCYVLHNTSPIVLVDSGGHLFARLAEPTMAEPGENIVFIRKKRNGAVFSKVKTAPENSPAPITNQRVDVSVTNSGSPWDTAARLDVLPTYSKQFDKTSKQTKHVKRVRIADADRVVGGLPHFSEHVSDDEFVPDKQPNDDPPALPKNLAESVKCYALLRMRPLSISWAECSVVISCGKDDYDKSG
jgi:hypothetical protein